MKSYLPSVVSALVLIIIGCDNKPKTPDELEKVAFAVVDGRPLTAARVKNAVLVTAEIRKLKRQPVKQAQFPRWANNAAMIIMRGMVSSMLVEDEAKRLGIKATDESDARILARYNSMLKGDAKSVKELAKRFGEVEPAFREQFAMESLLDEFFNSTVPPVKPEEVTKFMRTASNRVAHVSRVNSMALEKGLKAWDELKKGESWESVAAKYHEKDLTEEESADSTRDWYSFRLRECVYPEVAKAVQGMQAGEYTKPLETAGGLMIVKVNEIDGEVYTCVRIFIKMMKDLKMPDEKAAEHMVAKKNFDRRQIELIKELREKHKVEYPLGTNFVYKIWEEPAGDKSLGRVDSKKREKPKNSKTKEAKQ